jgi:hypothetical protein
LSKNFQQRSSLEEWFQKNKEIIQAAKSSVGRKIKLQILQEKKDLSKTLKLRISQIDSWISQRKKKRTITSERRLIMEAFFYKISKNPKENEIRDLADCTGLSTVSIVNWFRIKRSREKKKRNSKI